MTAAHVQLVVGHVCARHEVGDHVEAVAEIRAGRAIDLLTVDGGGGGHGIRIDGFGCFADDDGLALGGDLQLEVQDGRGTGNGYQGLLLGVEVFVPNEYGVLAGGDRGEIESAIVFCSHRLRVLRCLGAKSDFGVGDGAMAWVVHDSTNVSKDGGERWGCKQAANQSAL